MKNKNKNKIIVGGLMALVLGLGLTSSAMAYQGDYNKQGPNYTPERHEAMETAFGTSNYSAWAKLMASKGRVTQVVNEGNFSQFKEAHRLGKAGDKAGADAIRSQLGLRTSNSERIMNGFRGGNGAGQGAGMGRFIK